MAGSTNKSLRTLVLVLGDQLDLQSAAFDEFDKSRDAVWMAEVAEESTHVWSHKARIALFLAAMRHFRDELRQRGYRVAYQQLDDKDAEETFSKALRKCVQESSPESIRTVLPGDYRVLKSLQQVCGKLKVPLEVVEDRHFYSTPEEFAEWAEGRKQLRLEYFYRELRKKHGILIEDGIPTGGEWNYDKNNRGTFGKKGPQDLPHVRQFRPDETTQEVLELVNERFADHPGSLEEFDWPVTHREARTALRDFIKRRLSSFGEYQDAMWTNKPWLYHSRLSASMNLKMLDPRDVVQAALDALEDGQAPLNSVEGFIRQILGWREYVRGVYWMHMPGYDQRNSFEADADLPQFYWTGETEMHCLRQAIGQTLQHGYAHHIQRLMVTGLFSLLLGVDPKQVHEWYLAVYVDAVEWVEMPNTIGMSQAADGGIMASKPYVATGKYIQRMSNYCSECCYDPAIATGDKACPFTTLYWDFLNRHQEKLVENNRMQLQLRNLQNKSKKEIEQITSQASQFRKEVS